MNKVTRQQVIDMARTYIGTPWVHQGRIKHNFLSCPGKIGDEKGHWCGIDCVGFPIGVGKELGINAFEFLNYPRTPDGETLVRLLTENLDPLPDWRLAKPADLLCMNRGTLRPQHVLIVTERPGETVDTHTKVIEAHRFVMEHALDDWSVGRMHSAYQIRHLIDP